MCRRFHFGKGLPFTFRVFFGLSFGRAGEGGFFGRPLKVEKTLSGDKTRVRTRACPGGSRTPTTRFNVAFWPHNARRTHSAHESRFSSRNESMTAPITRKQPSTALSAAVFSATETKDPAAINRTAPTASVPGTTRMIRAYLTGLVTSPGIDTPGATRARAKGRRVGPSSTRAESAVPSDCRSESSVALTTRVQQSCAALPLSALVEDTGARVPVSAIFQNHNKSPVLVTRGVTSVRF